MNNKTNKMFICLLSIIGILTSIFGSLAYELSNYNASGLVHNSTVVGTLNANVYPTNSFNALVFDVYGILNSNTSLTYTTSGGGIQTTFSYQGWEHAIYSGGTNYVPNFGTKSNNINGNTYTTSIGGSTLEERIFMQSTSDGEYFILDCDYYNEGPNAISFSPSFGTDTYMADDDSCPVIRNDRGLRLVQANYDSECFKSFFEIISNIDSSIIPNVSPLAGAWVGYWSDYDDNFLSNTANGTHTPGDSGATFHWDISNMAAYTYVSKRVAMTCRPTTFYINGNTGTDQAVNTGNGNVEKACFMTPLKTIGYALAPSGVSSQWTRQYLMLQSDITVSSPITLPGNKEIIICSTDVTSSGNSSSETYTIKRGAAEMSSMFIVPNSTSLKFLNLKIGGCNLQSSANNFSMVNGGKKIEFVNTTVENFKS